MTIAEFLTFCSYVEFAMAATIWLLVIEDVQDVEIEKVNENDGINKGHRGTIVFVSAGNSPLIFHVIWIVTE